MIVHVHPEPIPTYRPGVGIFVMNKEGLVFAGRRNEADAYLQMPQGGLDFEEEPWVGAQRELREETGIRHITLLKEAPHWISYNFPTTVEGRVWRGRWRGQVQKWFAVLFEGEDSEINIYPTHGAQEFVDWRWMDPRELPVHAISFKKDLYKQVLQDFSTLLK